MEGLRLCNLEMEAGFIESMNDVVAVAEGLLASELGGTAELAAMSNKSNVIPAQIRKRIAFALPADRLSRPSLHTN